MIVGRSFNFGGSCITVVAFFTGTSCITLICNLFSVGFLGWMNCPCASKLSADCPFHRKKKTETLPMSSASNQLFTWLRYYGASLSDLSVSVPVCTALH